MVRKHDQKAGLGVGCILHLECCQQSDKSVIPLGQAVDVVPSTSELLNALLAQNQSELGFDLVLVEFSKDLIVEDLPDVLAPCDDQGAEQHVELVVPLESCFLTAVRVVLESHVLHLVVLSFVLVRITIVTYSIIVSYCSIVRAKSTLTFANQCTFEAARVTSCELVRARLRVCTPSRVRTPLTLALHLLVLFSSSHLARCTCVL